MTVVLTSAEIDYLFSACGLRMYADLVVYEGLSDKHKSLLKSRIDMGEQLWARFKNLRKEDVSSEPTGKGD